MDDGPLDPSEAYLEYAFARKRWRRVAQRFPRRYRKYGKGGKGHRPGSYAAFLPPNAFAGGKGGQAGGKSGFGNRKRNPKDKNGQTLKCNICGSEEHLWRDCPQKSQQRDGAYPSSGFGKGKPGGHMMTNQQPLALVPSQNMLWGPSQNTSLPGVHFFGVELENLRSVSQAASVVSVGSSSRKRQSAEEPEPTTPDAPSKSVPKWSPGFLPSVGSPENPGTSADSPMSDAEPKVSQSSERASPASAAASEVPMNSEADRATDLPSSAADAVNTSSVNPVDHDVETSQRFQDANVRMSRAKQRVRQESVQGLHSVLLGFGGQPDETRRDSFDAFASAGVNRRQVLSLETGLFNQPGTFAMPSFAPDARATWSSFMLGNPGQSSSSSAAQPGPTTMGFSAFGTGDGSFPWWEVSDKTQSTQKTSESTYHLRTRRQNGQVGLLVDPGAHDNLIGGITAEQMCKELKSKLKLRSMNKPLPVEGVGKTAQIADQSACIPMSVVDVMGVESDATYTAPIIQDSMLPPLLGNRTLRKMQVIMDCGTGKLIIPGPGGIEVKLSPGSKVYDLELTNSGHWVLPLHSRSQVSHRDDDKELAFSMSVRQDRPQSPKRREHAVPKSE